MKKLLIISLLVVSLGAVAAVQPKDITVKVSGNVLAAVLTGMEVTGTNDKDIDGLNFEFKNLVPESTVKNVTLGGKIRVTPVPSNAEFETNASVDMLFGNNAKTVTGNGIEENMTGIEVVYTVAEDKTHDTNKLFNANVSVLVKVPTETVVGSFTTTNQVITVKYLPTT